MPNNIVSRHPKKTWGPCHESSFFDHFILNRHQSRYDNIVMTLDEMVIFIIVSISFTMTTSAVPLDRSMSCMHITSTISSGDNEHVLLARTYKFKVWMMVNLYLGIF